MEALDTALKIAVLVLAVSGIVILAVVGLLTISLLRGIIRSIAVVKRTSSEARGFIFASRSLASLLASILSLIGFLRATTSIVSKSKNKAGE